jgi:signal peptidase I
LPLKPDFKKPEIQHIRHGQEKLIPDGAMVQILREVLGTKGQTIRFRAKGISMSPFIRDQDVITVSPVRADTLRRGHVIAFVFQPEAKLCVHRIIDKKGSGFVTQGDNLNRPDGIISESQVLGRIKRVERKGRVVTAGTGLGGKFIARFWHTHAVQALLSGLRSLKARERK